MDPPVFEARGDWLLASLPQCPAPWMVSGRTYVIVLRRRSPHSLPEAVVHDRDTDAVLGVYSWQHARTLFSTRVLVPLA